MSWTDRGQGMSTDVPRAVAKRRAPTLLPLLASGLLVATLWGCGSDDDSSSDTTAAGSASSSLSGTNWTLASATTDGKEVAAVSAAALVFDVDGKTVSGSTGCNQFSGTFAESGPD